jgi:hypothetical protein
MVRPARLPRTTTRVGYGRRGCIFPLRGPGQIASAALTRIPPVDLARLDLARLGPCSIRGPQRDNHGGPQARNALRCVGIRASSRADCPVQRRADVPVVRRAPRESARPRRVSPSRPRTVSAALVAGLPRRSRSLSGLGHVDDQAQSCRSSTWLGRFRRSGVIQKYM